MSAYDYTPMSPTPTYDSSIGLSTLPNARSMVGMNPEHAQPIPTKEQKEAKEQIDFSHGLLKDEITPRDIIFPHKGGYIVKRKGRPAVKISEIFFDKRHYRKDRYKKRDLLEKAIEIYNDPTVTDYDEVLKSLHYKGKNNDVITHYLKLFKYHLKPGTQPEEFLKRYQALGTEEDKDKLFWRMPCLEDILQGHIGDCFLLGSLQAIVNKDPTIILRMMRDNGNGTVTVRLFDEKGVPHYYIIEKMLCHGFAMNCMWVQMVERAFLIHRRRFPSDYEKTRSFKNKRLDIDGGIPEDALSSILGTPKNELERKTFISKVRIILDKKNGLARISTPPMSPNWPCVKQHAYAILGYMKSDTGFYILVTEPHRGSGGKYKKNPGVNYNPHTKRLIVCKKCSGLERMWLRVDDFTTPEELAYIISVLTSPKFKYLEERGRWYYEQQRKNKAVE